MGANLTADAMEMEMEAMEMENETRECVPMHLLFRPKVLVPLATFLLGALLELISGAGTPKCQCICLCHEQ